MSNNIKQFRYFHESCEKNTVSDYKFSYKYNKALTYDEYNDENFNVESWLLADDEMSESYDNFLYYKKKEAAELEDDETTDDIAGSLYAKVTSEYINTFFEGQTDSSVKINIYIKVQDVTLSKADLVKGDIFTYYYPIKQLNIQAFPGTMFYVNESPKPIVVDATGLFILDLSTSVKITEMHFEPKSINLINNQGGAYLIIDIVY